MHIDRNERNYFLITSGLLLLFFLAVTVGASANSISVVAPQAKVDPRLVATPGASNFAGPAEDRIRELSPGKYEVYILAQAWRFSPGSTNYGEPAITVPVGSTVTFYVTSKDIQHGFNIMRTNINFMVLPGYISKQTVTFDEPGTYPFVCNEYCGSAHHTMFGEVIVE